MSCPDCGAPNQASSRFCGTCGAALGAPGIGAPPRRLAQRMLAAHLASEGERKQVTILFADISGSTKLIEELDPEQAEAMLQAPLRAMVDAVHRYEGTVNRVQGDGIMALFGAPLSHEDNAVRAAFAAIEMQRAVQRLGDPRVAIRVGMHAGEVLVRSLRNDLALDYDVVGVSAHIAARIEQLAEPGAILCSVEVARQAEGLIRAEPRGTVAVRGVTEPIGIAEIIGYLPARTRWDVSTVRGLSPFAGRGPELARLLAARRRAAAGEGRVVTVSGEVGCGKTRLVHEFIQHADLAGWNVLRGAATPRSAEAPYQVIGEILRTWFEIGAPDPVADTLARVRHRVLDLGEDLAPTLPAVQALLGLPVEDPEWPTIDSAERRQRTVEALRGIVLRGFTRRCTLLWLEDLQWVDAETQSLIAGFAAQVPAIPCLLVVSWRPGFEPPWPDGAEHERIRIEPLETAAAAALLDALLGPDPALAPLRALVLERTEGVPLFIEETVRDLAERGVLAGERGAYRLAGEIGPTRLPAQVEGVIGARIDRLPPERKALLQLASVVGRDVPLAFLRGLSDLSAETFDDALAGLEEAGFLRPSRVAAAPRLVFKHALTHEVAYGSLLLRHRRALHAQVVRLIEERDAASHGEHVEDLAFHALRAELWSEAVDHLGRAAAKALELSAYREARRFLEQALAIEDKLSAGEETLRRRIDLRLALREVFGATGEFERLSRLLAEADAMAEALGDGARRAQINVALTMLFNMRGELDASLATGTRAAALARAAGHPWLRIVASFYLAQTHLWRGEVQESRAILAADTGWVEGPLRRMRLGTTGTPSVLWTGGLGAAAGFLGDFVEAQHWCRTARALAAEVARPYDVAISGFYAGVVHGLIGEVPEALAALRSAFAVCSEHQIGFLVPVVAAGLGYTEALAGNAEAAMGLLDRAAQGSRSAGMPYLGAWASTYLAQAKLLQGDADAALEAATRALETTRRHGLRGVEPVAMRAQALASARQAGARGLDAAVATLYAALERATGLALRPEEAHCHADLARLHGTRGEAEQAERAQRHALGLYDRLGMRFWAERVTERVSRGFV